MSACGDCGLNNKTKRLIKNASKCIKLLEKGCKYEGPYYYNCNTQERLNYNEVSQSMKNNKIKEICMIVVTEEEVKSLIEGKEEDYVEQAKFMGLAKVYTLNGNTGEYNIQTGSG